MIVKFLYDLFFQLWLNKLNELQIILITCITVFSIPRSSSKNAIESITLVSKFYIY
jgi:hypothetical protein